MRRFLPRERIRGSLLRGVYEQNLAILGIRTASRRRHRFAIRPSVLTAIFLGAALFGQPIPLSPLPSSSTRSRGELAAVSPEKVPPVQSEALTEEAVSRQESPAAGSGPPVGASDAAEYQRLLKGGDLKLRRVFGLGVKTIIIDPGHGGPSASGAVGKGGTAEKAITLDIARKLKAALERDTDYRILMTREDDRDVSLKSRVEMANAGKADLFISIHLNALAVRPIDMVETYYFGPTRDKQTLELAAEVNEGSDYSYSEYNEVIKEIANQLKYQESRRLAGSIQNTLYQGLRKRKPDVLDFGVKRAPFVVLLGVEMPGVLVEVACLSNTEEEERLKDAAYRETIAGYIETGIIRYLGASKKRSELS